MSPTIPTILRKASTTGDYGPIPTCVTHDRLHYVGFNVLVSHVARNAKKNPDTIWSMYLRTQGGDEYRKEVAKDLSARAGATVEPLIQFTDSEGVHWLIRIVAVHFVAQYDRALEYAIYKHFEDTAMMREPPQAMVVTSSTPQVAVPSSALALVMARTQENMLMLAGELSTVKETVEVLATKHEQTTSQLETHERQLADLRARVGPEPGAMTMREFVVTKLRRPKESEEQIKKWGAELSNHLRWQNPGWVPDKVWDPLSRLNINAYPVEDLEQFFRSRGLRN